MHAVFAERAGKWKQSITTLPAISVSRGCSGKHSCNCRPKTHFHIFGLHFGGTFFPSLHAATRRKPASRSTGPNIKTNIQTSIRRHNGLHKNLQCKTLNPCQFPLILASCFYKRHRTYRQQRQRLIGGASWCVMIKMVVGELLLSTKRRLFGDLCRLLNLGGQMVQTIHQRNKP